MRSKSQVQQTTWCTVLFRGNKRQFSFGPGLLEITLIHIETGEEQIREANTCKGKIPSRAYAADGGSHLSLGKVNSNHSPALNDRFADRRTA